MKLLLAGASCRNAAALEVIIQSIWQGAQVERLDRDDWPDLTTAPPQLAACELLVLDLLGMGRIRWTLQTQAELEALVSGRRVALMLPSGTAGDAFEQAWEPGTAPVMLRHPVSAKDMREALLLAAKRPPVQTVAPRTKPAPAVPAPERVAAPASSPASVIEPLALTEVLFEHLPEMVHEVTMPPWHQRVPEPEPASLWLDLLLPDLAPHDDPPAPRKPTDAGLHRGSELDLLASDPTPTLPQTFWHEPEPAARPVPPCGLTRRGRRRIATAYPAVAKAAFVNVILDVAMQAAPCRLDVGQHTAAVFCPQENWVATNISTPFRRRLTQHKLMLQLLATSSLTMAQAIEQATPLFGRRADGRRPLDAFLWSLVFSTFEHSVPAPAADVHFMLTSMPNFTRLPGAPELFIRLSLACLRRQRSVRELTRQFADEDLALVHLFVICALLSGMAVPMAAPGAAPLPEPPPAPAEAPSVRGRLQSLLGRWF